MMGDKHLLVCASCHTFEWLELYEFPTFMSAHTGHKITIAPSEAIGETDAFDSFLKNLLSLFAEKELP